MKGWVICLYGLLDCRPCMRVNLVMIRACLNRTETHADIEIRPRGYKTFSMLNSAEHEICPAHKCKNANIFWHFNIHKQEK